MNGDFKKKFLANWQRFFPGAELPIGFYYAKKADEQFMVKSPKGHRCVIADLANVRKGKTRCFDISSIGCDGGKRHFGFDRELAPDLGYFLSYGIPGKLEGERYKKYPDLVNESIKNHPSIKAPERYIIFKRWDIMDEDDRPLVLIFFARPDVLSGLFTLANYDETEAEAVISPFGAGCLSIVAYPYNELRSRRHRAVMGMFDVSARPFVPAHVLTFAVPWPKFARMADNMEESFLITKSWGKVKGRIKKDAP